MKWWKKTEFCRKIRRTKRKSGIHRKGKSCRQRFGQDDGCIRRIFGNSNDLVRVEAVWI